MARFAMFHNKLISAGSMFFRIQNESTNLNNISILNYCYTVLKLPTLLIYVALLYSASGNLRYSESLVYSGFMAGTTIVFIEKSFISYNLIVRLWYIYFSVPKTCIFRFRSALFTHFWLHLHANSSGLLEYILIQFIFYLIHDWLLFEWIFPRLSMLESKIHVDLLFLITD